MTNIVHYDVFNCFQQLNAQLEQVEKEVQNVENALNQPLPSSQYNQLFRDLDKALLPLKKLQQDAHFLKGFGDELIKRLEKIEARCPVLYGDIITGSLNAQVLEITHEAEGFKNSILGGELTSVAQKVHSLREHISTLCSTYRLGDSTMKIAAIEEFIKKVEKFINEAPASWESHPESTAGLQKIAAQAHFKQEELDAPSAELLMELFEIAELYEQGQLPGAKRKLDKLPANLQRRIDQYKEKVEQLLQSGSHDHFYAPALYALSMELSRGGKPVCMEEELSSFYSGLEEIAGSKGADEKELFSERSYESWGA